MTLLPPQSNLFQSPIYAVPPFLSCKKPAHTGIDTVQHTVSIPLFAWSLLSVALQPSPTEPLPGSPLLADFELFRVSLR